MSTIMCSWGELGVEGDSQAMKLRSTKYVKYWCAYHFVWIPKCRNILVGDNLRAGIDLGVNNLFAIYIENGRSFLINGRPLKSIAYYWQRKIAKYQSILNKNGCRTSRKLRRMYAKWRKLAKYNINTAVRKLTESLYEAGVSIIYVEYLKNIAQQNGNSINLSIRP